MPSATKAKRNQRKQTANRVDKNWGFFIDYPSRCLKQKPAHTCDESQTPLALMYSLAPPYDAKYPLNHSDRSIAAAWVLTLKS
jgi:hypothetical protein